MVIHRVLFCVHHVFKFSWWFEFRVFRESFTIWKIKNSEITSVQ